MDNVNNIYKLVLIEKLKNPENWIIYKDDLMLVTYYYRIKCFDDKDIYFKINIPLGGTDKYIYDIDNTVHVCEDVKISNPFGIQGTIKISNELFHINIHFYDFKLLSLINKLRKYHNNKKEEQEKNKDIKLKESFLPKVFLRKLKIDKIKKLL